MKKIINIIFLLTFCLFPYASLSGDLTLGKQIAQTNCGTCHGLDGQSTGGGNSAITPNLTGQKKEYMIAKLKDYRSGKLQDGIMTIVAGMLSDEQIEDVAAWYSSIKITIELPAN